MAELVANQRRQGRCRQRLQRPQPVTSPCLSRLCTSLLCTKIWPARPGHHCTRPGSRSLHQPWGVSHPIRYPPPPACPPSSHPHMGCHVLGLGLVDMCLPASSAPLRTLRSQTLPPSTLVSSFPPLTLPPSLRSTLSISSNNCLSFPSLVPFLRLCGDLRTDLVLVAEFIRFVPIDIGFSDQHSPSAFYLDDDTSALSIPCFFISIDTRP